MHNEGDGVSREADALSRALTSIELTLGFTTNGTADRPRRVRKIDLAVEHMEAWRDFRLPRDGERGGSSSPTEHDDRLEARRVDQQVARDLQALPELIRTIETAAQRLYSLMLRNVETIDLSKLPKDPLPGCVSCARVEFKNGRPVGGHFAPVYDKSEKAGLCRWCWDARQATGKLPEVDECDVYHREGPRAAGLLRAKRERRSA